MLGRRAIQVMWPPDRRRGREERGGRGAKLENRGWSAFDPRVHGHEACRGADTPHAVNGDEASRLPPTKASDRARVNVNSKPGSEGRARGPGAG